MLVVTACIKEQGVPLKAHLQTYIPRLNQSVGTVVPASLGDVCEWYICLLMETEWWYA